MSVYLLEAEKSKTLEEDRRRRPERYLSDDAQAELWLEMGERLAAEQFAHYEISNWARGGRRARHNLKYWTRTPTLGLGVSAHELWGGRRRQSSDPRAEQPRRRRRAESAGRAPRSAPRHPHCRRDRLGRPSPRKRWAATCPRERRALGSACPGDFNEACRAAAWRWDSSVGSLC